MSAIRIRQPFLAAFVVLVLLSAYLGLSATRIPTPAGSDKGLHFVTFFLLTVTFYWILETTRRRCIHLTLVVCTAGLSIGSEVVQALIPNNGRDFDPYDIVANVVGSGLALLLCTWYHKRMLERKRKNKSYDIVPGEQLPEDDVELGLVREDDGEASTIQKTDVTEELDHWDENAEDWDEPGEDATKTTDTGDDPAKRSS